MTLDLATVLEAVAGWPAEDRRALMDRLADGLADDGPPLSDALKAELDRRLALYKDDPTAGDPWEVVEARLLGKR